MKWEPGQRAELRCDSTTDAGEPITEWEPGAIFTVRPNLRFISIMLDKGNLIGGPIEKRLRPLEEST